MRLLLLGCTGFIGSELVPRLANSGHQLTVVSRKSKRNIQQKRNLNEVNYLNANPASAKSWQEDSPLMKALENSEGVINLVGEPIANKRWTPKHCKEIESSRLRTTEYLVKAISKLKKPLKVMLNSSAIGFYGTSQTDVFNENSPAGQDFLAKLCSQWEAIASTKPTRTRLVIIRTGIVLEKDGGALGKMLPIFRAGFGGPIGNGLQWMSWIHRTDLCQILENALTNNSWSGIFNGVSPNPVSMGQFTNLLGKTLNRPNLLPVPGPILKILLGDGAKVVLEGQQVVSNRLAQVNFKFRYPELTNALKAITHSY
ncbi:MULTISPECIES: TIGR01777 family oxidoreductase [Prochlorococcus]|uniref:Predicted nucleoside-diphosphate sugar epimerase n=1 Tax=Prochlorococcus marinus (strain SARG / CCMP1375 / SS120) TaxID=167539 RepID=Q7VE73_PROMA|nr:MULTISPECIES: TIGR01777 family oxidoreductase [Prochlorococcus]AAP99186.1 Predicted nucleoside-diphosphate sugar epimerase [Prochlorococcus marinus subsp. marinus str. CCMP1375]KGG11545.1 Cell division inhibitor [Prochlorococcus marinus str. LG]KGG18501.1 Cell division inhibitor [Prochlorococcus marinus str. SS2]KGG22774.1 Cell division inhibitor [Prochlorococcus marinus str. SS35]KGG32651.1 Cell division inhibitor [Prochlorococcus marinus str. SS51]